MGKYTTGKYVVPPEIRDLKPQNITCTVKKIKGHYYVCSLKEVPDIRHPGKTKFITDKTIGKIEGGRFIPKEEKGSMPLFDMTVRDYGDYATALSCSKDIWGQLKTVFSDSEARQIYALSIVYFVEGYIPSSYVKDIFDQSLLSLKWPGLAIDEKNHIKLLKQLGLHNLFTEKFQQSLIDASSGWIALTRHVFLSCSSESDLADYGNEYPKYGMKQLNLMMAYDIGTGSPLTCKAFDGDIPAEALVQEWFEIYHFSYGTTFLLDAEFYSEENLGSCRANNSFFIIPVPDRTLISRMMRTSIAFTGSFQYCKSDEEGNTFPDTVMYREATVEELEALAQKLEDEKDEEDSLKRLEEDGQGQDQDSDRANKGKPRMHSAKQITHSNYPHDRVIMYRNEKVHDRLANEFLSQVGDDNEHTEEIYKELEPTFGLMILRLNSSDSAEAEYTKYKKRWSIESNDSPISNDAEFDALQLEDYYITQGLSFLILIEDMIYRRFMRKTRASGSLLLRHMSKRECLLRAGHAKVILHPDHRWHGSTVTSDVASILKEMGVSWEDDLNRLNDHTYESLHNL